ncbi:hypothetical protein SRB5_58360 [Streptomyces sp. RB5]|uniref:Uncharacterized protein n=1 Tax=Streptomyces smaragdinus TaxID=2585196 RepID=A0A7K0CQ81_9ACTN|nr:hypothetical protein [Streptomyces smaragdinus]MQY15648.1 hypothetical protein [Streptomyces smaragdinus]
MHTSPYGSRPDLLPDFIRAGNPAIHPLSLEESRAMESVSINRFQATIGGRISFEAAEVVSRETFRDEGDGASTIARLLRDFFGSTSEVVTFWDNLIMPTVRLPVAMAVENSRELLESDVDFWFYSPGNPILIECRQDGNVTVAHISAIEP